jgi:tetratricopeptide (TPR) repeat protein
MPYEAFISYRSADLGLAERLEKYLRSHGLAVWFDRVRLSPGFDWHAEIESGCDASRVVLPILTPDWKNSDWCRFETYGAEHVIPLLFSGEWEDVAPAPLRHLQYLDFRQPSEAVSTKLLALIHEYVAKPGVERPPRFASLPYGHNLQFVGRDDLLVELHELLHRPPTAGLTQGGVCAVTGIGGVGKTTIAREYAEKFWRLYGDVHWVRADPGALVIELARLALEMHAIPQASNNMLEDARAALRELNTRTPRLLVFDNAQDESTIQPWLPTTGGCRVIVTSRYAKWSVVVPSIGVGVLHPVAARSLLARRSGASPDGTRGADQLAEDLGFLPLALEQAAAFMHMTGTDVKHYRTLYARTRLRMLSQQTLGGTQYPDSVATTWHTTIERLGADARAVLRFLAHLAPDDIPISLLAVANPLGTGVLGRMRLLLSLSRPRKGKARAVDLETVLALLASYSMITLRGDAVGVHRLVQTVQRDEQPRRVRRTLAKRAIYSLYRTFPVADYDNFPLCARLLPHAKVAAGAASEEDFRCGRAALLFNQVAIFLQRRGQYADAEPLFRQAIGMWRSSWLGRFHPLYATGLSNLGILYSEWGRYAEAEQVLLEALELRRTLRGRRRDPLTGNILGSLGTMATKRGDFDTAEAYLTEALEIRRNIVGEGDVLFGAALSNIATLYEGAKRFAEAAEHYRAALTILRPSLPAGHPEVTQVAQNLAVCYYHAGKFDEAERLYVDALRSREVALGDVHPDLAYILTNLGKLYRDQGRHADAERVLLRAERIRTAALGESHPELARTVTYLGTLHDALGRHDSAEVFHLRALHIVRSTVGEANPLGVLVMENYARSLRAVNRIGEAEVLEARACSVVAP